MYIITDKCVFCRVGCIKVCPVGAISYDGDKNCIDQSKCIQCGACAKACAVSAIIDPEAPIEKVVPHEPIKKDCDVLVIGAGGSGLIAACRAAAMGGGRVIAIERAEKPFGCGWYSGGCRPYASKWQLEADPDLKDPTVDYVRAAMNTTVGVLNPKLVYTAYNAQTEFFDWYCEWGHPEVTTGIGVMTRPGEEPDPNAKPGLIYKEYKGAGSWMLSEVYDYAKKLGVEFLFKTSAYEFVMKDGRVAAVKAKDDGGEVEISCKALCVAAGNLVNNREILQKCIPDYVDSFQRRSGHLLPSNQGDGVTMAEKAGIPIDYANICAGFIGEMSVPFDPNLIIQDYRAEVLKVNKNGERFMNEHSIQEGSTFALLRQPNCVAWHIMDDKIVNSEPVASLPVLRDMHYGRMMFTALPKEDGSAPSDDALMVLGPIPPIFGGHDMEPAGVALKRISELKGEHVVIADTLEELAEKMGAPVDTFVATVKRYNELCAKGHDDDYFKQDRFMLPIEQGPFYAIHNFLATDGVFGGYFVDENMRVLDGEGGTPIEGLYASGDNTSSRFINRGGQRVEIINDYPWALASGFTAGGAMAEYIKNLG